MITDDQYNALEESVDYFNQNHGRNFQYWDFFFIPFLVASMCFFVGNLKIELENRQKVFSDEFLFFVDVVLFFLTFCWIVSIGFGLVFLISILL